MRVTHAQLRAGVHFERVRWNFTSSRKPLAWTSRYPIIVVMLLQRPFLIMPVHMDDGLMAIQGGHGSEKG